MGRFGFFVTIEGIEGSGKSTLLYGLKEYVESLGLEVVITREPGGTEFAESVRDLILHKDDDIDPWTEVFLLLAARRENVTKVILPALRDGKVVISDRYTDSTLAYQGYGRGLPLRKLSLLNKMATSKVFPRLTFIIDLPVEKGFGRKKGVLDRIEKEKLEFHERVRNGYLALARKAKKRIKVLDGTKSPDELLEEAKSILKKALIEKGKIREKQYEK